MIDATVGINMQNKFKMAIRFGFYLTILNFVRVIVYQIGIWMKNAALFYVAIVMYVINFLLFLVWFVFTQIWRWSYPGRVCSGDYLSKSER